MSDRDVIYDFLDPALHIPHLSSFLEKEYSCYMVIGIELEFYVMSNDQNAKEERVDRFISDLAYNGVTCIKEHGKNQYEIVIKHQKLTSGRNCAVSKHKELLLRIAALHNLSIDFSPKPKPDDYGSSMHLHISLHDIVSHENLFSKCDLSSNNILINCIGGILSHLQGAIYFITGPAENEYERFIPGFLAPTHIAWGFNNRTAVVRIPDGMKSARRIEFRLPSASANAQNILLFLLIAIIDGLHNNTIPIERLYGNAFDPQYNLEIFPKTPSEARKKFSLDRVLGRYNINSG